MTKQNLTVIPILTTPAGSCLTVKNWQEAGVTCVSYELAALLLKPGLAYLKTLPHMVSYFPWEGEWVLNVSTLKANSEGIYVLRSPFDGSRITCSLDDIVDLLLQLKPTHAILPQGFHRVSGERYRQMLLTTMLFIPVTEAKHYPRELVTGLYYAGDSIEDVLGSIQTYQLEYPQVQHYVADRADLLLGRVYNSFSRPTFRGLSAGVHWENLNCKSAIIDRIVELGVKYIESDFFASEACDGRVSSSEGMIDLKNPEYALQFDVIESGCICPTCAQHFTRAYLHHLLEHTPLLCQRMLIQHNFGALDNVVCEKTHTTLSKSY